MLFDFSAHELGVYDRAGGLCWRDSEYVDTKAVNDLVPFVATGSSPSSLLFATSPHGTQYRTESVSMLPPACIAAQNRTSPLYIFDAITTSLREFYPFAHEHDVDWAARTSRLRPRMASVHNEVELLAALTELFRGVQDPHTSLAGNINGKPFRLRSFRGQDFKALQAAYSRQNQYDIFLDWVFKLWMPGEFDQASAALLSGTRRQAFDNALVWGRLKGNIGYLAINEMAGFGQDSDLAEDRTLLGPALDQALADLKDTRAMVLDISHDLGGDDEISSDIASRFADRERKAYSKQAHRGGTVQRFQTVPHQGTRYLKPVYLLTSELTASAAEVFAIRMRGLPNVVQVGEATQGVFSDSTEKGLPNGWVLAMSTEIYRDPEGRSYEGTGLSPAVPYRVIEVDHASCKYRNAILYAAKLATTHKLAQ
jgi:carboxyl-terminal processing protease